MDSRKTGKLTLKYWLVKSEPGNWSWEDQVKAGKKGTEWDGVRNYQARNYMREMKNGDLSFFYHSVDQKMIVGVVKVIKEFHPDSTDDTGKWECVDFAAVGEIPEPVSLDQIKTQSKSPYKQVCKENLEQVF